MACRFCSIALGAFVLVLVTATPSLSAEWVKLQFGMFSRSVSVSALETFAHQGTLDRSLSRLLGRLDEETLAEFQSALVTPHEEDPLIFSQKLRTPMGTRLLQATGLTVQTGGGLNGQIALRAALSKAAEDPDGLSLINTLRYFPTDGMTLDLKRVLSINRQVQQVIQDTDHLLAAVERHANTDTAGHSVDYADLPDLRERGPYSTRFVELNLVDGSRDRPVPADLFLPDIPDAPAHSIPVVVFSHGLGHSRIYFRDIAEHLATYGFAVAMPEHLGSNEDQRRAMETWMADEFFQRREFVNRPQDVSFLLDELERMNESELNRQLNLQKVGAIGHSFGGYTALITAGATVDFDWLQRQCAPDAKFIANISQLLQCRALELETSPDDRALLSQGGLRDERVQMVMTFNTVSSLFGQSGTAQIQIPTLIAGGVYDFVTPVIPEQADTFRWLTTPDKYFLLVDQKAHGEGSTRTLQQFVYALEDELDIELAQWWLRSNYKALLVAFTEVYLAGRQDYRSYLEPAYARHISVEPFLMHLVRDLPDS
jgi:predicted dienelactone hydrolase